MIKLIRDIENKKKDTIDIEGQPKKKQRTFTNVLGDYCGVQMIKIVVSLCSLRFIAIFRY